MSKITMIKKDAIISIKISSGFLQMLQRTMMFIVTDKTEEDLENFKKALDQGSLHVLMQEPNNSSKTDLEIKN